MASVFNARNVTSDDIAPPRGLLTLDDGRTIKVFHWEPCCKINFDAEYVTVKIEGYIQRSDDPTKRQSFVCQVAPTSQQLPK